MRTGSSALWYRIGSGVSIKCLIGCRILQILHPTTWEAYWEHVLGKPGKPIGSMYQGSLGTVFGASLVIFCMLDGPGSM